MIYQSNKLSKEVKRENLSPLCQNYINKIKNLPTTSFNQAQKDLAVKIMQNTHDDDLADVYRLISKRVKTGFVFDSAPPVNNQTIAILEERPELSFNNTQSLYDENGLTNDHLLIIGENYDALKNLLLVYKNKIGVIYIDPPYNTDAAVSEKNNLSEEKIGAKFSTKFVYRDKFSRTGWLNMMNERLLMAKELLTSQGLIFVSIDDHEQAYLKVLMDEIFGEENFLTNLIWHARRGGGNDKKNIAIDHETILVYAKDASKCKLIGEIKDEPYKGKKIVKLLKLGSILANEFGITRDGTKEIKYFNLKWTFLYPKPKNLILNLLKYFADKKAIVLDFFAGSGTTAHAVMALNQEDGGSRKFILCTNNEEVINKDGTTTGRFLATDICYERLHRIMKGEGTKGEKDFDWIKKHSPYQTNSLKVFEISYTDVSINANLPPILAKVFKNLRLIDQNFSANEKVLDKLSALRPLEKEAN